MLNSTDVQRRIEQSYRLQALVAKARGDKRKVVQGVYLTILSRLPTPQEMEIIDRYAGRASGPGTRAAAADLIWALLNTKEFLYRH